MSEELSFVAISGIRFPTASRRYLMGLVKEVAQESRSKFILIAGDTVDGGHLEADLKQALKQGLQAAGKMSKEEKEDFIREYTESFIEDTAEELSGFLPEIKGVNYHIVIAEKVFDRPLGVKVLEALKEKRNKDIRLIGRRDNGNSGTEGSYNTEVKVPIGMAGFEEIRVLVPSRTPWFYRIITGLMQRLINSFVGRTFSPKPSMILVGGTGTGAYLPFYEGVPSFSVPTLHKIDEQRSSENMVGCVRFTVISENGKIRIIPRTYDFRSAIFNERELVIPKDASRLERAILGALRKSSASLKMVVFRINAARNGRKKHYTEQAVSEGLAALRSRKVIFFDRKSNRFVINEKLSQDVEVSLKKLLEGSTVVKHVALSCVHVGALKTLYYTIRHTLPKLAQDADAIIENGDEVEGMAHNYEYNGEVLPPLNAMDKQEIIAGRLRAKDIVEIFEERFKRLRDTTKSVEELLEKCLITYVFNAGNHPAWKYWNKGTLVLYDFETELTQGVVEGVIEALERHKVTGVSYRRVKELVSSKIIRTGESRLVTIGSVTVGVKHPFKARTQSKSQRIQEVVDFLRRKADDFAHATLRKLRKLDKKFAIAYVANFHEASSAHVVKFGETVLGVMTGAVLKDTSFESDKDKVVDWGFAVVTACLSKEGRLVYNDVEYVNDMHPKDEEFVLADHLTSEEVLKRGQEIMQMAGDLRWR